MKAKGYNFLFQEDLENVCEGYQMCSQILNVERKNLGQVLNTSSLNTGIHYENVEIMLIQVLGAMKSRGLQMMEEIKVQWIPNLLVKFSEVHFVINRKSYFYKKAS